MAASSPSGVDDGARSLEASGPSGVEDGARSTEIPNWIFFPGRDPVPRLEPSSRPFSIYVASLYARKGLDPLPPYRIGTTPNFTWRFHGNTKDIKSHDKKSEYLDKQGFKEDTSSSIQKRARKHKPCTVSFSSKRKSKRPRILEYDCESTMNKASRSYDDLKSVSTQPDDDDKDDATPGAAIAREGGI